MAAGVTCQGSRRANVTAIKQRITAWFERNCTWRGIVATAVFVVKEIPSWFSREAFWSKNLPTVWKFVYAHSTFVTLVLVGLVIWLDHRRVIKLQAQRYDLKTLRGRTLQFCDKVREFQKSLGSEPQVNFVSGMSKEQFNHANEALARREQKMHHGFKLRFYAEAAQLWHEHGQEMRENYDLGNELAGRIETDEQLNLIIKQFSDLAEMSG